MLSFEQLSHKNGIEWTSYSKSIVFHAPIYRIVILKKEKWKGIFFFIDIKSFKLGIQKFKHIFLSNFMQDKFL